MSSSRPRDCSCSSYCCCKQREDAAIRPKATPLPWSKLIVVCSALFVNQFGINMIFPFLPFMIHDFFPYLSKTELGHKAGYLGSAYFFGNFVGSFLWGWVSDRLGRRPVLLMGVTVTIVCELFFGFSQNFTWAIVARLLWGLLNGNIGVVKTYISEICDDTNQAKGFAVIGTSGGISRLLGSVVGGFLSQPANKYHVFQVDFFCRYPYSLPCIVGGCISLVSLGCTWLFLDETLVKNNKDKDITESADSEPLNEASSLSYSSNTPFSSDSGIEVLHLGTTDPSVVHSTDEEYNDEKDMHLFELEDSESATDSEYDISSDTELLRTSRTTKHFTFYGRFFAHFKNRCFQTYTVSKLARKVMQRITDCIDGFVACAVCLWTYKYANYDLRRKTSGCGHALVHGIWKTIKVILDRRAFLSVFLYGVIAFLAILHNELLPLLLVTDHEHGGYDMDASEISVILMVAAVMQLLLQFFVFPRISKWIGFRHTFKLGCAIFGIFAIILPLSNHISGPVSSHLLSGNVSESGSGLALFDVLPSNDSCGNPINTDDNTTERGGSVSRVPSRVWAVIMTNTVLMVFSRMIAITSVMVLISNSTLPADRGTINGFGQSAAALGRMLGPIAGAPLFAWSETSGKGWPLNYHLVFDLLAMGSVGAIVLCFLLPASIEKKRENRTTTAPAPMNSMNVEVVSDHNSSDDETEHL